MKPSQVAQTLRHIASKIQNSKNPDRELVARDLKRVVTAMSSYQVVFTTQNNFEHDFKNPPKPASTDDIERYFNITDDPAVIIYPVSGSPHIIMRHDQEEEPIGTTGLVEGYSDLWHMEINDQLINEGLNPRDLEGGFTLDQDGILELLADIGI